MERAFVWAERGQADFVRTAVARAGLALAGVGASSSAAAGELAATLDVPRGSDLRRAALHDEHDVIWIATPEHLEADERRTLRQCGKPVFTCTPRPVRIDDLLADPDEVDTGRIIPLFRRSDGYRAAMEIIAELGPPNLVSIVMAGPTSSSSLLARLYDAMDLIDTLCPQPEGINASLSGPLAGVPETLEGLHGHLAGSIRFGSNCAATVAISDCSGAWTRRVALLSDRGSLSVTDRGFVHHDHAGNLSEWSANESLIDPGELVGERIRAALDHGDGATDSPPNARRVLALCEAARLSCRTRQDERPERIVEMYGL